MTDSVFRIGTAEPGSTFSTQGRAIAQVLAENSFPARVEIVETRHASTENVGKLERGEIDVGFIASNWVGSARRGERPFEAAVDVRLVAPMNRGPMYFIARADSGLARIADLRGKRIAVGPEGSGTRRHAETILGALGIGFDDVDPVFADFASGADMLAQGRVDAQLQCPYPNRVMDALDASVDLTVISLSPEELERVVAAAPVYCGTVLRTGALRALREDSLQAAVLNVLITHPRADAARIELFTRLLAAHAARLEQLAPLFTGLPGLLQGLSENDPDAFAFEGATLHPGARAAYLDARL